MTSSSRSTRSALSSSIPWPWRQRVTCAGLTPSSSASRRWEPKSRLRACTFSAVVTGMPRMLAQQNVLRQHRSRPSGGGELALGGLEHAGAVLVRALVLAHGLRVLVGRLAEGGADLLDRLRVVAGPRLGRPAACGSARSRSSGSRPCARRPRPWRGRPGRGSGRRATISSAVRLPYRAIGRSASDATTPLAVPSARAAAGALRAFAAPLRAFACRGVVFALPRRGAGRVRRARLRHVVGAVAAHVAAHDGVRQLRDLREDSLEHALLVLADRGGEARRLRRRRPPWRAARSPCRSRSRAPRSPQRPWRS